MKNLDRRRFLKTAGAAAATGMLPASIRDALAIPANNKNGTVEDVEHVVILMQENRSFDHYFGMLPGVRGFGDRFTIPLSEGRTVWEQRYETNRESRIVMPYHLDKTQGNALRVAGVTALPHTWADAQPAWDNGRMADWPTSKSQKSMGYYKEAEVEFQYALANAFTVCDNYFAAIHAGTNPNRIFHWTGINDPTGAGGGPAIYNDFDTLGSSDEGYSWTTYPERLQDAGVTWKVYQNLPDNYSDNPLGGFKQYREANEAAGNNSNGFPYPEYDPSLDESLPLYKGVANTMPSGGSLTGTEDSMLEGFLEDVASGNLPQVSWVIAPTAYSEHPSPSSPVKGAWYVQKVLTALTENPELFSKTVFIVNFDENDGFFDHLPPPCAPSINDDGSYAGKSTLADTSLEYHPGEEYYNHVYGPGPRVPLTVISPWSRGGWVNSQAFDHTSVLRFLEQRFGVEETNISPWRRAFCGDLMSCFNFVNPNDELPNLPVLEKRNVDSLTLSQQLSLPVPVPDEDEQQLPQQPAGLKLSRALPYELHATSLVDADAKQIRILFACTGQNGAVFHVYDKLHLDRNPRRYGVEAGMMLDDIWDLADDDGQYDLWVLGPNGWHRHFTGNLTQQDAAEPEVRVCYDLSGEVYVEVSNRGAQACTVEIVDNAYGLGGPWTLKIASGATAKQRWPLADSYRWYDFSVTLADDTSGYSRRFAGRLENGEASVSDPAMGVA